MFLYECDKTDINPVEVVEYLKSQVYDHERFDNLEIYMDYMAQSIWRFYGKGIDIQGSSLEEKCASLVDQLIQNEFLTLH